jgi:hypothetical protein
MSAMGIDVTLAFRRRLPGAAIIVAAIFLSLVAAALQASSLRFSFVRPFDHTGIFHFVQMPSLLTIACGARLMLRSGS